MIKVIMAYLLYFSWLTILFLGKISKIKIGNILTDTIPKALMNGLFNPCANTGFMLSRSTTGARKNAPTTKTNKQIIVRIKLTLEIVSIPFDTRLILIRINIPATIIIGVSDKNCDVMKLHRLYKIILPKIKKTIIRMMLMMLPKTLPYSSVNISPMFLSLL